MGYQILKNFLTNKVRKGDIYIPSAILLLLKNNYKATFKEVARLLYIFEYKHSLDKYELIVKNFVSVLLEEYSIAKVENENITLTINPIEEKQKEELILLCYKISNGFFKNLNSQKKEIA